MYSLERIYMLITFPANLFKLQFIKSAEQLQYVELILNSQF